MQDAYTLLNEWFSSPYPNDWGSKGFLIDKLSAKLGISKAEARRQFDAWNKGSK